MLLARRSSFVGARVSPRSTHSVALLGYLCSLSTTLSISALVTNTHVRRGGVYSYISRSLGKALGGSVGLMYAVGLVFDAALEAVGSVTVFKQVTMSYIPEFDQDTRTWTLLSKQSNLRNAGALALATDLNPSSSPRRVTLNVRRVCHLRQHPHRDALRVLPGTHLRVSARRVASDAHRDLALRAASEHTV